MIFSILTPSRERMRNGKFPRFINSIISTVSNANVLDLRVWVDSDDPEVAEYESFCLDKGISLLVGPPQNVSKSWNDLFLSCSGDVIMMGNDDQIYETRDWDIILSTKINSLENEIYCIWFNDRINQEEHCAFPIVSRTWCNIAGHYTPGIFNFFYNDTWIFDIATKINKLFYLDSVVVTHKHYTKYREEADLTTKRNRNNSQSEKDAAIFKNTETERNIIANRLANA